MGTEIKRIDKLTALIERGFILSEDPTSRLFVLVPRTPEVSRQGIEYNDTTLRLLIDYAYRMEIGIYENRDL